MEEYIEYPNLKSFKVAVNHLNECHIFIVADSDNDHAITKENGVLYDIGCLTIEGKKAFSKDLAKRNIEWGVSFKLKKPVKPIWYLFGMFGVIKEFPRRRD